MDKKKLYQSLALLFLVILVFSVLSRLLTSDSMTLSEYASKNASQTATEDIAGDEAEKDINEDFTK